MNVWGTCFKLWPTSTTTITDLVMKQSCCHKTLAIAEYGDQFPHSSSAFITFYIQTTKNLLCRNGMLEPQLYALYQVQVHTAQNYRIRIVI